MQETKSKLISITEYIQSRPIQGDGWIKIEESLYNEWWKDLLETVGKIEAFDKALTDAGDLTFSVSEGEKNRGRGEVGAAYHKAADKLNELLYKYEEL